MTFVPIAAGTPLPQADPKLADAAALRQALAAAISGEVRFDAVSRALYSTDASVYQIEPIGVAVPRTREDIIAIVEVCRRFRCPLTMRGGGTSQAGQAIGGGVQVDISKHYNRVLEVNPGERWVRVQPGIVLDELNAELRPHGLRFAPDITTAARATIGGMIANNSSGARSVLYGKTIDHVLELDVILADGSVEHMRPLDGADLDAACERSAVYRTVRDLGRECAGEVERRFPRVMRRVGGYNLDEFGPGKPFNLAKLMVGSEGTLGVILEAKLNLVPLPKSKAVLAIQFRDVLEALAATPAILEHKPSAVEVMDKFILDHTKDSPRLQRIRETFIEGDPGALLCVEFYDESTELLRPRLEALERDLRGRGFAYHFHHALDLPGQARIWSLREAGLGLSMAMKEDAKSISFVEDTAVAPERLRDYIERFLGIIREHNTSAGIYAHASVGCLHVRPVVNMKTAEGVGKFESIAAAVSDLVLEFGGALSGEHGDGLVRSPFLRKMFGPLLYEAFRTIKRAFDPEGILNPGKIVDPPPLTANLRFGAGYVTPNPPTFFDFSDYGGFSGAVEMCSGLGVCRKRVDGTMCPSYMATHEEADSTRGRANVLRLAMAGRLGEAGLAEEGVFRVLDLCLECRACKAECPVSVDMARHKSEFLAAYWAKHGTPWHARLLGNAHAVARWGSRVAPLANAAARWSLTRVLNEKLFGIDRRRTLPEWSAETFRGYASRRLAADDPEVLLFADTFTDYYNPEIGIAAWDVLEAAGFAVGIAANVCCGRPQISKGLLPEAREQARRNTERLHAAARQGRRIVFCEPSCLSAVREDAPDLLRGDDRAKALEVAAACDLFENVLDAALAADRNRLALKPGPARILLHGHCHQKSMGLLPAAQSLLARIPGAKVIEPDAGCCGMAGSFGYSREHFDISRQIAERRLLPAIRSSEPGTALVAAGVSCRHQIRDFAARDAVHPAVLLRSLLERPA
ncbi:MAG: FAD-binding protein [Bryobacterales bacterium]|nr:FAD-binding protein [Bryobacterales bacterium]